MVSLQKSEKRKNYSYQVKIILQVKFIPKRVSITAKRVKITPKELKPLLGELTEGKLKTKELSLCEIPKKVKLTLLGVFFAHFEVSFTRFGMIFTHFESDCYPVRG